MSTTQAIQIISISTALFTSGGIAALSGFCIPLLRSQPSSRSLPMLRWLFSRGSHTAPPAILVSSAGFLYLAYTSVPASARHPSGMLAPGPPALFLAASALSFSCALFTSLAMLPTNFALIARNEAHGGAHSAASAAHREAVGAQPRTAEESVDGKEDVSQWTDTSDPQSETARGASEEEDEQVRSLLSKFSRLNYVRAGLMGGAGVVGLVGTLG